jgi:hypothetical protein
MFKHEQMLIQPLHQPNSSGKLTREKTHPDKANT